MTGLGFLSKTNHSNDNNVGIWDKWKNLVSGSIQDIARGLHMGKPRQPKAKELPENELETLFASVIAEQTDHVNESENK